jgi:hypothetical protein
MRDRTRGRQSGVLRWLGVLVALAASLALYVSPAAAVNGVGSASARGTLAGELNGSESVVAQFSARSNCDAAQSTGPFYVRWIGSDITFTFKQTGPAKTSGCNSVGSGAFIFNANDGTADGEFQCPFPPDCALDGLPGSVQWQFSSVAAVDGVNITVMDPFGTPFLVLSGEPQPWNGSPGGVWLFGELPWPPIF